MKLKDENIRLYVTFNEPISLICSFNIKETLDLILNGTGELTINKKFEFLIKDYILLIL